MLIGHLNAIANSDELERTTLILINKTMMFNVNYNDNYNENKLLWKGI